MDFFITHDLWFVPLLLLLVILLLGLGIGFINGWKTSVYFFVWNFIALIISVFTISALADNLTGFVNDLINNNFDIDIDASSVTSLAIGIVIAVGMVGVSLVINMLALIIYFFFRKKLKREIKENKAANKSNLLARVVGAGVGFFTAMPIASGLAATSTIISNNQGVNKVVDNFMFLSSFGQVKHISQDFDTIVEVTSFAIAYADLTKFLDDATLKGGVTPESAQELLQNRTTFEGVLASTSTLNLVKDTMSDTIAKNPSFIEDVVLDDVIIDDIKAVIPDNDRFYVPSGNVQVIKDIITLMDPAASTSTIDSIFDALFRTN